jgi:outer membrane protein OmpA-like peptidoglycan-associated protein
MQDNFNYITCPKCGHDRNLSTAKKCEICGYKLGKATSGSLLPLALVGGFIGTGLVGSGFLLWRMQSNSSAPPVASPGVTVTIQPGAVAQKTITVLGDTFSGYSTFRNQAFQATLKASGLQLNYKDEFNQAARAQALSQGQADIVLTTLDQFLQHQPQGKIVGLIDRTVGADAVVLNTNQYPKLRSLLDLQPLLQQAQTEGKRLSIAFAGDTPSEYLALVLDTKFDAFNLSDFDIIRVADASEAHKLMQDKSKNVALAVLWEPFVSQAREQGNTVVLSSQDAPNTIIDVLVASNRLLESQPELVNKLVSDYYRRIDVMTRDTAQLQQQVAEDGKLSPTNAGTVIRGIDFFTAPEAQAWMSDGTLRQRIGSTAALLVLAGRLSKVPDNPENLFAGQYLTQAAQNTKALIDLVRADNPELADKLAGIDQNTSAITVSDAQVRSAPNIGNLQVRGEVQFAMGSAKLTSVGQQTLNRLSQEIAEFNPTTVAVRVIGHTSRTGAADFNQSLSQARAKVVVDYLSGKGLKQKLIAEGKGFSTPLPGANPVDARNQRTEIRLVRLK